MLCTFLVIIPAHLNAVRYVIELDLNVTGFQFSLKMLYESLIDTAKTTAMVFIILIGAAAFTGVFMSLDGGQIIQN